MLCLAVAGCSRPAAEGGPAGANAPGFPVKVTVVEEHMVPDFTDYLATLRSRNTTALQPQVEGAISKIFVQSGQKVEAGTPVLEIDPLKQEATVSNQEAGRKSKEATLAMNRAEFERRRQLFSAGVISRADLDTAQGAYEASKADVDALEASVREQRVQLRYYTVKAPTSGIVGDVPVHIGDRVTSATMLTTIDKSGGLEAYISVPAEKARDLKTGMFVDILDGEGKPAQRARISFISPQVDSNAQTLLVKAAVANADGRFRNEQSVHARVIWSEHKAALVPVTAVSRLSGKIFAFVAEGQGAETVARQRILEVGELAGNDYVVRQGLKPGDRLITSGIQLLADGMKITPQP
jgi:RND family efflux transporter MFP subunit